MMLRKQLFMIFGEIGPATLYRCESASTLHNEQQGTPATPRNERSCKSSAIQRPGVSGFHSQMLDVSQSNFNVLYLFIYYCNCTRSIYIKWNNTII